MNDAIVFNVFFNGLGVIRALGENGIPVKALDNDRYAVGKYSKYLSDFQVVANPGKDERKFVQELIKIGRNYKSKPVLFPTNDIWSIAVSKYKNELEKYFLIYNPDYSVINKIINKKTFYRIMQKESILVPQTYEINSFEELNKVKPDLKYPLILKPNARMDTNRKSTDTKLYNRNRIVEINKFEDFMKYADLIK